MARNFLFAPHVISVFRLQNLKLSILGSRLGRFHKKINRTWRHNQSESSSNKLLLILQQCPLHSHSEGKHCTVLHFFKSQCFDGTGLSSWWLSYVRKWLNKEGQFSFVVRSSCLFWCNLLQRHNSGTEGEIVIIFHIRSDPESICTEAYNRAAVNSSYVYIRSCSPYGLYLFFCSTSVPALFPSPLMWRVKVQRQLFCV